MYGVILYYDDDDENVEDNGGKSDYSCRDVYDKVEDISMFKIFV
jgi:hypothetical protein